MKRIISIRYYFVNKIKNLILSYFECSRFQAALKKYGVPEEEIFQTADLYERRNIAQVTLCLNALSRLVIGYIIN